MLHLLSPVASLQPVEEAEKRASVPRPDETPSA